MAFYYLAAHHRLQIHFWFEHILGFHGRDILRELPGCSQVLTGHEQSSIRLPPECFAVKSKSCVVFF